MGDYDKSIHDSADAHEWAVFFCDAVKDLPREKIVDEAFMIGWFANAMMAMYDKMIKEQG